MILLGAAAVVSVGVLFAVAAYQDHVIASLRRALEIQARATSREHARAEVLASELEHVRGEFAHLQVTGTVVTLWTSLRARRIS